MDIHEAIARGRQRAEADLFSEPQVVAALIEHIDADHEKISQAADAVSWLQEYSVMLSAQRNVAAKAASAFLEMLQRWANEYPVPQTDMDKLQVDLMGFTEEMREMEQAFGEMAPAELDSSELPGVAVDPDDPIVPDEVRDEIERMRAAGIPAENILLRRVDLPKPDEG